MLGIPSEGLRGLGFRVEGFRVLTSGLGFSLMWGYATSLFFLSVGCPLRSVTASGSAKGVRRSWRFTDTVRVGLREPNLGCNLKL